MKYFSLAMLFVVLLAPVAHSGPKANSEDDRLGAFFKEYLNEEAKARSLDATRLGDHRYDHLLDDLSANARAAGVDRTHRYLAELPKKIGYKKLTRNGQIDFEIWQHALKRDVWLADNTKPYEEDARVYNEYITESTYVLLTQSTLPKPVNVKNAAARMAFIPRIVEAARANLKNPPKVFVETAIKQNRGAIAYYESGIFELAGETPQLSTLAPGAKKIVPVLREYQKFLEQDLLPRAKGDWRLGKERFAQKLELELNAGVTADEVLKEAEAEADRVEAEMYVVARQLWNQVYPGQPAPPDDIEGKRKTIRLVLDRVGLEHGTPANLLKDTQATVAKIKCFITDKDILRLPEPDRCKVIEMPEFQRGNSIAYCNPAPPLDPKASSYYAISPPPASWSPKQVASFLQEYNRHMLQVLTIHEAYPGHYVQLEYGNRCPSLIRKVLYSGVFAEGWAVYTEQMMLDQGYGDGDLKLRLNQLKFYMRAVCNAILDHKMHSTNMTDEEALLFLILRSFQSEAEAILKIIRAKQSSCQLSTYFVGRQAFQKLRRQAQNQLGKSFNLGQYHEACLDHGTLPVRYLPELVAERLKQPR